MFYGSVMKCINQPATTFVWIGGQFQIGNQDGPPETFTTIAQVEAVDFTGSKRAIENVTSADNTDGADRKAGRTKDWGTVTVTYWLNPNDPTHQQFENADDGLPHNFKCINPAGLGQRSFVGIVETISDHKLELAKGTKVTAKVAISGPITFSIPAA
jgi:hypothetical protein